jgi:hypothetical protein
MKVTPWVKHDRLEDEVMVVDLQSGAYFAFVGAAADAWSLLAAGVEPDAAGPAVAERYGVPPGTAAGDVATFAAQLVAEGLLEDTPADAVAPPALASPGQQYTAPTIERFDDLADLLLLDPIHEVEQPGWPARRKD